MWASDSRIGLVGSDWLASRYAPDSSTCKHTRDFDLYSFTASFLCYFVLRHYFFPVNEACNDLGKTVYVGNCLYFA